MAIQVDKYRFPNTPTWYNSERRETKGVLEYYSRSGIPTGYQYAREYDYRKANVQYFLIDISDTTEKTVDLFTYANGVAVECKYKYIREDDSVYTVGVHLRLRDKDDNYISGYDYNPTIYINKRYYPDKTQASFSYTVPSMYYFGEPVSIGETYPQDFYWTGRIRAANNWVQSSPYAPPALEGEINGNTISNVWGSVAERSISTTEDFNRFLEDLENGGDGSPVSPQLPSDDTSGTGGGDDNNPDYNPFTDPIAFPDLPNISILNNGLISAYKPNDTMLTQLGTKLWSANFVEEIKKINNDPMEAVISLHLLPFDVPTSTSKACKIGNYNTEINMPTITQQFVMFGGGDIDVRERFASALDYSPYTTAHIHIPFVGIVPLDIDYIMNKHLALRYQIDVLTGSAVAMLRCNDAILYTFPCNLAMTIPLTSSNHQALYREVIQTSAQVGHTIVAGATGSDKGRDARIGHGVVSSLESALNTVCSKHSEVQKSGSLTGVQGILDSYDTYLIFHRPIQSLAERFAHFKGFPCNITYNLSSLSGYTEVEYAHLEGVTATDAEKDEIQMLLQAGVLL